MKLESLLESIKSVVRKDLFHVYAEINGEHIEVNDVNIDYSLTAITLSKKEEFYPNAALDKNFRAVLPGDKVLFIGNDNTLHKGVVKYYGGVGEGGSRDFDIEIYDHSTRRYTLTPHMFIKYEW